MEPDSIHVALARLETKMDAVLEDLRENKHAREGIYKRLNALETWRSWLAGAFALIAGALAYFDIRLKGG